MSPGLRRDRTLEGVLVRHTHPPGAQVRGPVVVAKAWSCVCRVRVPVLLVG